MCDDKIYINLQLKEKKKNSLSKYIRNKKIYKIRTHTKQTENKKTKQKNKKKQKNKTKKKQTKQKNKTKNYESTLEVIRLIEMSSLTLRSL